MKPLRDEELEAHVIRLRRDFHLHPELSGEERRTSAAVTEELTRLGIAVTTGYGGFGVLGVLEGEHAGPTVGLRADMDALPIEEQTQLPFASVAPGVMHACGHDAHTAMLLGAAHELTARRSELRGRILFIFQPSEETAPLGGAKPMMEDGLFERYKPDVLLAQHVWPKLPTGRFGVKAGPVMGASDKFTIMLTGKGGHAAMPHQSADVLVAASQIVTAAQTIVSRNVDPLEQAVVTFGTLHAGTRYNVLPEQAHLEGTVRSFNPVIQGRVQQRLQEIVCYTAQAMGVHANFHYERGYPATINDEDTARFVRETLVQKYGAASCPPVAPSMAGEDFSRFLERYPGVYYWLGVGGADGNALPLHDPAFDLDEAALRLGYTAMVQLALTYGQESFRTAGQRA